MRNKALLLEIVNALLAEIPGDEVDMPAVLAAVAAIPDDVSDSDTALAFLHKKFSELFHLKPDAMLQSLLDEDRPEVGCIGLTESDDIHYLTISLAALPEDIQEREFFETVLDVCRFQESVREFIRRENPDSGWFSAFSRSGNDWLRIRLRQGTDQVVFLDIKTHPTAAEEVYRNTKLKKLVGALNKWYEDQDESLSESNVTQLVLSTFSDLLSSDQGEEVEREEAEAETKAESRSGSGSDARVEGAEDKSEEISRSRSDTEGSGSAGTGTGLSSDSGIRETRVGETRKLYLRATVNDEGHIIITPGGERANTRYGRKQADHVTAYALLLRAVFETIDMASSDEILSLLTSATCLFAPQSCQEKAIKMIQVALSELGTYHYIGKAERKTLTARMRTQDFPAAGIAAVKFGLRRDYSNFVAGLIENLSTLIIEAVSTDELSTYSYPVDKKTKEELGQEGSRVRSALEALRAVDKLLKCVSLSGEERIAFYKSLSQDKGKWFKRGLNVFRYKKPKKGSSKKPEGWKMLQEEAHPWLTEIVKSIEDSVAATEAHSNTGSAQPSQKTSAFFTSAPSAAGAAAAESAGEISDVQLPNCFVAMMSQFILDCFDFDYHRQMAARLFTKIVQQSTFPFSNAELKALKQRLKIISARRFIDICQGGSAQEAEGEAVLGFIKKSGLGSKKIDSVMEKIDEMLLKNLQRVCQIHLEFIRAAFPHAMEQCDSQQLVGGFIDLVCRVQGWSAHPDLDSTEIIEVLTAPLMQATLTVPADLSGVAVQPGSSVSPTT